jgi:hypothetical protein
LRKPFAEGYPDETAGIVMVDAPGPDAISDAEREQAMKYRSHRMSPPYDRLPAEIQKLQLWAQMLPAKVAVNEENDYIPEEFQLLYEIQQFGHPLGGKPLITMIGMQGAGEETIEEKKRFRPFQQIAKSLTFRMPDTQSTYKIQMP